MTRILTIAALAILLSSCAKPPYLQLDAAEYMLNRAQVMQADQYAPTEYQAAQSALNDARGAMQEADYGDAEDYLEFALHHARRAVALAEDGQKRRAEEEARQAIEAQRAREAALQAQAEEDARKERARQAAKPVPKPKAKIVPVAQYSVGEGENLWTISAQPQVYNEGLLWPLLYQANRDQIKDPKQIFPGQTLSVRRDMTSEEMDEARQKARESDIFPVPQTELPQQ